MATQHGAISWTLTDEKGIRSATDYIVSLDDTKTLANLIADVQAIQALLAPLSLGGWVRQELRLNVPNAEAASATPGDDADAGQIGAWTWGQAGNPYGYTTIVPVLSDAVIVAGKINPANASVIAYQTGLAAAFTNGTRVVNRGYANLTGPRRTFLADRKHRRQLHARSVNDNP
jgi:hypothetical protein